MARYDRIARIDPPDREGTFAGWMTLRDLEGREREPQLGRRARLRFLALRPVRRLLLRGLDGPEPESLDRQIESVREEMGALPASDRERVRLAEYLREIGGRSASGMVRATLDVGAAAEIAGQSYAAEEYYLTGLELATAHELRLLQMDALRRLGRVYASRHAWERALAQYRRAAELADEGDESGEWARAMDGIATVHLRRGQTTAARRVLDGVEARGRDERDGRVRAIAAAARCALELTDGDLNASIRSGWDAVQGFEVDEEDRFATLLNLASAFRRLGRPEAAESAYGVVAGSAAWPEHRSEALVEHAATAAESGDAAEFRARRERILGHAYPDDPQLAALLHLGLGRGCMLVDDADAARDHLRKAIGTARDGAYDSVLSRAEELLQALEKDAGERPRAAPPRHTGLSGESRRIAERIEALGRELVTSA